MSETSTDTSTPEDSPSGSGSDRKRKILLWGGVGAVVIIGVVLFAGWYFLIRDDSAASVTSDEAAEARDQAIEEAAEAQADAGGDEEPPQLPDPDADVEGVDETTTTDDAATDDTATDDDAAAAADDPAADDSAGLDGTWEVDTTIGTFEDACLTDVCSASFVGFRIDEELASIGAKTVVGRSPDVSGSLELAGTTIEATDIVVDMTGLVTDSGQRTNAIRRQAIETNDFPEATFTLTSPIELGAVPAEGEAVEVEATGDLTIHGVTQTVTIPLTAELRSGLIVVFGQFGPFPLADFDIEKPSAAVVLSVEDVAIMELQLFFSKP